MRKSAHKRGSKRIQEKNEKQEDIQPNATPTPVQHDHRVCEDQQQEGGKSKKGKQGGKRDETLKSLPDYSMRIPMMMSFFSLTWELFGDTSNLPATTRPARMTRKERSLLHQCPSQGRRRKENG